MKNKFFILWFAGIISTVIALPYIFALQHEVLATSPLPLWQIGLIAVAQAAILLAIAVFGGLKLSQHINLPVLQIAKPSFFSKEYSKNLFGIAVPTGVAVALIIKLSDLFFAKFIPQLVIAAKQIPFWKALLVAPYGGVVEELLTRLFLVSLFAWFFGKIFRIPEITKSNTVMWLAIIISAVLFGLGHLPATATITQITPLIVTRAILLNGIGGLVFGWLYWKKGLEYSIVAHFSADIVLIAILPSLIK